MGTKRMTGEVVAAATGPHPYKVVFKLDGEIVSEWPVISKSAGESHLLAVLGLVNERPANRFVEGDAT